MGLGGTVQGDAGPLRPGGNRSCCRWRRRPGPDSRRSRVKIPTPRRRRSLPACRCCTWCSFSTGSLPFARLTASALPRERAARIAHDISGQHPPLQRGPTPTYTVSLYMVGDWVTTAVGCASRLGLPLERARLPVQGEQIGAGLTAEDHHVVLHGRAGARYRGREPSGDIEEGGHAAAPDHGAGLGVELADVATPVGDVDGSVDDRGRGRDVAGERGHPDRGERADVVSPSSFTSSG